MKRNLLLQGAFWITVYILIVLAPLLILMVGSRPPGREFLREFSVALGFAGLAMMALQFVLTARFQVLKAPYGSDIVYHFHRQISLVAFTLILAHPILLFINDIRTLRLLNLLEAPWRARAGVTALLGFATLIALSLWRKRLNLDYTKWRITHSLLATLAIILAMAHVILVGNYINTPLKQVLWIAYGVFWIGLLVYVRVLKPFLMLRCPYRVEKVIPERGSAWTVVLSPEKHPGMKYLPGQFAWLTAWHSPFSDTEHPFSFSSSAARQGEISFTIKELGDFTRKIKDLHPGQRVYLDGPFGAFSVDRHPNAEGYIFIAGGIGITPIMSMLRTLADRGDRRPLLLIYANKNWGNVTFREEIELLKNRLNLQVVHVLEHPPHEWQGEKGFITQEILDRYIPADRKHNRQEIFICGPQPMMNAIEKYLVRLGISVGDFHSERFDLV